ncbi:MAG: nitrite reductase large subunit, partial [Proteobacteria bacterium]|nr:nitrite reductase large subunit [Pseudomonadota bacterium]
VYVGGAGGIHLRGGDLLGTFETEEELTEIVGAFLQYYREEAHYAERTHTFMERLGIERVRRVIVEDLEERKSLVKRINVALAVASDPWKERVVEAAAVA